MQLATNTLVSLMAASSRGEAPPVRPLPAGSDGHTASDASAPAGKEREITFSTRRIDPAESAPEHVGSRALRSSELPGQLPAQESKRSAPSDSLDDRRVALADRIEESRQRISEQPDLTVTAKNFGVTYRIHPDLRLAFQGEIFDRSTTETVRRVPSDLQVELARRYQKFIGQNLDVIA